MNVYTYLYISTTQYFVRVRPFCYFTLQMNEEREILARNINQSAVRYFKIQETKGYKINVILCKILVLSS